VTWGYATTLVIPFIAIEKQSVRESLKTSTLLLSSLWSQAIVTRFTTGVYLLPFTLPALIALYVFYELTDRGTFVVLFFATLLAVLAVWLTTESIVSLILYLYARTHTDKKMSSVQTTRPKISNAAPVPV
jgi:hypothetical protein